MLKETKQTHKALADALSKQCASDASNTVHATGQVSVGHAIDDPKPKDADEYKVAMWKMRAQQAMGVITPEIPVKAVVCSSTPATAEIVVPTIKKEPCAQPMETQFSDLDEFSQACYFIL